MTGQSRAAADRLREIIREKSFGEGVEITLASGQVSNFYFNMKPAMMNPEGAAQAFADAGIPFKALFRAEEFLSR